MTNDIFAAFSLPSGKTLKNRLVKGAMEENLANAKQLPDETLFNLYQKWAEGGVGLIITGNIMVDAMAMTGPGGMALEEDTDLAPFATLAQKAKRNNTRVWMQINHPGRQVFKKMGGKVLSPSNVALDLGKHSRLFGQPKAMTEEEIQDVIQRFTETALLAEKAGFDGVEVHAAHGYLLAQFLSPLVNQRTDQWGGSLENRARLLIEIITAIRKSCAKDFSVAVKLNSADFQRGGFDVDDAIAVVKMLEPLHVDVVELSGGSYEAPAMQGHTADDRTLAREAYFLEFASKIAQQSHIPIMTTGGIKRLPVAQKVLESGVDLVGMATALAYNPDLPNHWQQVPGMVSMTPQVGWKDKTLSGMANMALVKRQLRRLGKGKPVKLNASAFISVVLDQILAAKLTKRYRRNMPHTTK
ncbi:NADH:flavin oxidoreductase/NADH oxidase family protein [Aliiglaciecola sp. 3_MG-2023]|uniref:NADH:flavin oxidoreductase/NADH oxidase family protein n=1 Tax=Aliiglaciecola sp. 3_MG-2023 TaxID=3062644 RepID=UPI0026E20B58|nr:NADH:flavin oxidoreductase/NADH oxidase family protein [Aliiglaciecola sp. 3_MG-2023]MDO6693570.1 NADH:flavin oxidoreductase/NADH oxidase family protein [Aliiglaciecola sp. 3_MG-2023]